MPTVAADDASYLRHAISIAREHMLAGEGGPFGALVVRGGVVLAEGWNQVTSTCDPTAHAEVVAIRRACAKLGAFSLEGATLYASAEPCPMCLASAYWARVARIVHASTRDEIAAIGFDDARFYDELAKLPAARAVPMVHAPHDDAAGLLAAWTAKVDRVQY